MEKEKTDQDIEAQIAIAREHNVHIDAAVSPFIDEKDRQAIITGQAQDPEWD
jgi:hypothetical protein